MFRSVLKNARGLVLAAWWGTVAIKWFDMFVRSEP
jgi:hypothetical protein